MADLTRERSDDMLTPDDLDLGRLRSIAEKAPQGPWTHSDQEGTPGHCVVAQVWNARDDSMVEVTPTDDPAEATATADYIAAFDPPTVLALLASARPVPEDVRAAAERTLDRYTDVEKALACIPEHQHTWNAHRQCQWCHKLQADVDDTLVARHVLAPRPDVEKS